MLKQSENNSILSLVQDMSSKNLDQIKDYSLLNRTDTKYVLNTSQAEMLFKKISNHYFVLEVNSNKVQNYESYYFDTEKLEFYHKHHNKKNNRSKVRFRKYIGSDLIFLETKTKSKGRTRKYRKVFNDISSELNDEHYQFIRKNTGIETKLIKSQQNTFSRITLLGKRKKERITIDYDINFNTKNNSCKLEDIVICEVKQERIDHSSDILKSLKSNKVYPLRLSKYCIGSIMLDKNLKQNRFKKKLLKIKKLQNNDVINK